MFQLDPASIAARVRAAQPPTIPPSLETSVARGMAGFTVVSLGGFGPWVFASRWFHQHGGEGLMYVACAIAFIILSGLLLHPLIIGPGALRRFYQLFGLAFGAYAIAWTVGWMALGGNAGSVVGLLAGTGAMGWVLTRAFVARGVLVKVISALFVSNTVGYFAGGWAHVAVLQGLLQLPAPDRIMLAKAVWGLSYGLGFGAGIGLAFYWCQTGARQRLAEV